MSWLFSRALVEASSGAISSDGALYAPLSATPTPPPFSSPGRTTKLSRVFPSGMTCERLTAARGEAVLTWCLAGSPVKVSAPLGRARDSQTHDPGSGSIKRASWVKYDHDTSLWRTHQYSLLGGLVEFSGTWPRWGTMRDGECWVLATPERPISGTASGSSERWPTPTTSDATGGPGQAASCQGGMNLRTAVQRFPTPTVNDSKNNNAPSQSERNSQALNVVIGGNMSPMWVEWLMGWPIGWTDLQPLEMDRFRQWCDSHGAASD